MKRIYILASERSGSNLLRVLLGNHSAVAAPKAPHLLNFFGEIVQYYGDLDDESNYDRLLKDFRDVINDPYHSWDYYPELNDLPDLKKRSLVTVTDMYYSVYAEQKERKAYVSKGIHNYEYVSDLLNAFDDAKFIYLHRDPRDHVASWLKTPLFMHSPFVIIKKWKYEQDRCLYMAQTYPDSVYRISYEDLIANTPGIMAGVLKFLDLEVEEGCFSTGGNNRSGETNEFWKNLNKPIIRDNARKYLKYLNKRDLNVIESYAKPTMKALGYTSFESNTNWNGSKSYIFHFFDILRRVFSRMRNYRFYHVNMKGLKDKLEFQTQLKKNLFNQIK